ncbi:hypothetical protein LXL04_022623 [Taraxacum kok-saghyz]
MAQAAAIHSTRERIGNYVSCNVVDVFTGRGDDDDEVWDQVNYLLLPLHPPHHDLRLHRRTLTRSALSRNLAIWILTKVLKTGPITEPVVLLVQWFNWFNRSDRSRKPDDVRYRAVFEVYKTGSFTGSRLNRSDRPVRTGFQNTDLDDIFGDSLNLEDTHKNEGYQEGYDTGFASGKDDGREVGIKTGFITGEELGFYRGCIDVWTSVVRVDPTCFSNRVQKKIKEMDDLVSKYPILDPENENVTDIMGLLRLKFRAICATINMKLEYKGYPKASGSNEIQF